MKMPTRLIVLLVVLFPVASAIGQTANPSEKKLTDLQGEISSLEQQKKTGMYLTAGGLATQVLSLALVPSTKVDPYTGRVSEGSWAPFYLVLGAGTVVGIVGIYKWYDAAQQLGPLKAKRYDLGLIPTWDMRLGNVGVALVAHF